MTQEQFEEFRGKCELSADCASHTFNTLQKSYETLRAHFETLKEIMRNAPAIARVCISDAILQLRSDMIRDLDGIISSMDELSNRQELFVVLDGNFESVTEEQIQKAQSRIKIIQAVCNGERYYKGMFNPEPASSRVVPDKLKYNSANN